MTELECIACGHGEACERHHDTEPSPPPSGNVTTIIPESDPVDALMARLEMTPTGSDAASSAAADPGPLRVAPSGGDSVQSYHVVNGLVVEGPTMPAREWYDYGLDTGPRVRVRGIVEGKAYDDAMAGMAKRPDATYDEAEHAALHAESEKAFAEGDTAKLSKMYEDVLDEIHSPNLGERKVADEWFSKTWGELEAALTSELRELSRQERRYDWGFRVTEQGLSLRCVRRGGDGSDTLEVRLDKKALKARVQAAAVDAKESAAYIVKRARDEVTQARAKLVIGGPSALPYEDDAARA